MLAREGYSIDFVVGSWGVWSRSDMLARVGYTIGFEVGRVKTAARAEDTEGGGRYGVGQTDNIRKKRKGCREIGGG